MKQSTFAALFGATLLLVSCQNAQNNATTTSTPTTDPVQQSILPVPVIQPPVCAVEAKTFADGRTDEYYWLNQRTNQKVIDHLKAENAYVDSALAPVASLRARLYDEMKARIKEDDSSVPYFKNGYFYYVRFVEGQEYAIYCRKKGSLETSAEEILLDGNALAKGKGYMNIGGMEVSPDNGKLVYLVDYTGRNLYKWYVKDLTTGALLPENAETAEGAIVWAKDAKSFFYSTKDKVTLRFDKVWQHTLGQSVKKDVLKYYEKDDTKYAGLTSSKSDQYAFIDIGYGYTDEVQYLDMSKPEGAFQVVRPREAGVYYNLEDAGTGQFLVLTNLGGAKNFKLMTTPVTAPQSENWKELVPHDENVLIEGIAPFKAFLVISERRDGQQQLRIMRWSDKSSHSIDFGEKTRTVSLDANPEFDTKTIRYVVSSPRTPATTVDYDVDSHIKIVKKVQPVLGSFDTNNYETDFVWATAKDGTKVPISLVYRKNIQKNGKNPCLLIGYGSYGFSYPPSFNRDNVSLLDRGFVIAIAHIRGGTEMGFKWYEQGKLGNKMNTFTDFITCAEHLIAEKYTTKDRLFAQGGSAGGLLMGAVANMRPDLFKGMIAAVPFVDVLTTMSDPSIPLTTGEYKEWGNPAKPEEYAWMQAYSPYDNLKAQDYPNMLVTTALEDSQVQYFEPAKWVARLRTKKTDKNLLLLHTQMEGSHGGASGRFKRLEDKALQMGWMLGLLGMQEEKVKQ
jgi:oligopeptidase B